MPISRVIWGPYKWPKINGVTGVEKILLNYKVITGGGPPCILNFRSPWKCKKSLD